MSIESYRHFSFLHQQGLSNLRGRCDPKTEENADIFLVTVSFHVVMTKQHENLMI